MADENPYAPPSADVDVDEAGQLAGRGARLGGALLDGLIAGLIVWPIAWVTGFFDRAAANTLSYGEEIGLGLFGFVVFILIQGYPLATRGQTIGKILVQTRIVSVDDGKILPFGKLLGLRYLPIWLATQVPIVGGLVGLVDALFVFRDDRRCVHDLIAGTRVIKA